MKQHKVRVAKLDERGKFRTTTESTEDTEAKKMVVIGIPQLSFFGFIIFYSLCPLCSLWLSSLFLSRCLL